MTTTTTTTAAIITELVLKHGFTVFPLYGLNPKTGVCTCKAGEACYAPGKHPCVGSWKTQRPMQSRQELETFFRTNTALGRNFGMKTGERSKKTGMYLYVVDLDSNCDDDECQSLSASAALKQTFQYNTGKGKHFWLWSKKAVNSSVRARKNTDLRGTGGYVVIPPSTHKTGVKYGESLKNNNAHEIVALELEELLAAMTAKGENPRKPTTTKQLDVLLAKNLGKTLTNTASNNDTNSGGGVFSWWTTTEIKEIREQLAAGKKKIPIGVRNTTLHRLLSSDRARGTASKQDLADNLARYVKQYCVEPIDEKEQRTIVDSVSKYPLYNNKAERVLEIYAKWREKRITFGVKNLTDQDKKELEALRKEIAALEKADNEYFLSLKKGEDKKKFPSLKQIKEHRRKTLQNLGFHDIHEYNDVLFTQRLKKLGFSKYRTKKSGYWGVQFPEPGDDSNNNKPVTTVEPSTTVVLDDDNKNSKEEGKTTTEPTLNKQQEQQQEDQEPPPQQSTLPVPSKLPSTAMTIFSRNVFTGIPIEYLVDPKKKYLVVSDFFESDLKGGAELTTEAFIRECPEPDLVAKVHSANLTVEFLENNIRKGMHVILGNFTQVPEESLGWLVEGALTTDYVRYSVIEYDFKLCCYRSLKAHFMQTQQKCNCYNESHGKMIEALYKYAEHLFWMSEKQQALFHKYLPELAKDTRNQTVLGSAFTPDDLSYIRDVREGFGARSIDKAAILGSGSWIKGIPETEQLLSQQGVAYVKLPALEHKKFLMELGKYKRFCFKPLDWDTCPRVVIEAKLLGLDLDLNENVLMQEDSWWKDKTIEELEEYLYNVNKQLFWEKLQQQQDEETAVAL